ncbi:MAG: hypothetical protein ACD_79C00596G0003 [uncultured bacterium]|nr:MAG: hypothetical protein ACD_79C00596G0003 [uncultured bacterium]
MKIDQSKIRNIAIIAHVDHGKTTLVDKLFKQSGMFRDNQVVEERMMDSMDQEKERGITISSKNGAFHYKEYLVNIIDTPGHADFGGQVERIMKMADGALLLVDAQEGPMPQTYFVLKKALAYKLPVIVVINKIDRPHARPEWAVNEVFDLFVKLEAPDNILDFPVIYASAKDGYAVNDFHETGVNMIPLLDEIIAKIPPPKGDRHAPLQLQVTSIDYSSFLGRLGIGKITSGHVTKNQAIVVSNDKGELIPTRISKIYRFDGNKKVESHSAGLGEIVAIAGLDTITVGDTYTDPKEPIPCERLQIDPPTISMNFIPNDSPFSGQDGQFVTSRHLEERLRRESLSDVALKVEELDGAPGYKVSGRGELHLSVLIEKMRREGYEFQVSRPQVIMKETAAGVLEPYEELIIDVDEQYMGTVIEKLGKRKGLLQEISQSLGMAKLRYVIPTRGILGFKAEFMSDTKGLGVMNYIFDSYKPFAGEITNRVNGVLVSMEECSTVAYALFNLQNRGRLFFGPGVKIYKSQIVGEHCRNNDLSVNPAKGKKLTNVRAAGCDENVVLTPPSIMSLESCIAYINDDELIEVTPKAIRMRKKDFKY